MNYGIAVLLSLPFIAALAFYIRALDNRNWQETPVPIEVGQTYRSLDPRGGPQILIVRYEPGWNRANVVDAQNGQRPRSILVTSLHSTATTRGGKPRRTGYVLEER
ncbi:hypothetical protein ABZ485_28040 [Streptomyces albogriseolus]|uniref:hypothetical protein n=1 Tax=Streptomyces albogriseolus TaxID=1887 RepID=UPI003460AAC5